MAHHLRFIFILLLLTVINNTHATCGFSPVTNYTGTSAKTFTIPLDNRTFSVPPDMPVGQVIANQWATVTGANVSWRVACSTGPINEYYQYGTLPRGLANGFSDTYQTGLTGIGVRYRVNRVGDPFYPYNVQSESGNTHLIGNNYAIIVIIEFVKTAAAVTPGIIYATNLPTAERASGQATSKIVYAILKMSGQFNITVPTCDIAPTSKNMTVQMGKHESSSFSGIGSGSAWKNASIQLINCPQFYGSSTFSSYYDSGSLSQYSLTSNRWSLTLSPRSGVIDAAKGIMKIDNETGRAIGVGIQLSASENVSGKINLNEKITKTIVRDGSVNAITIPLYARYIQTEDTIIGGKANGKLEYVITYQ